MNRELKQVIILLATIGLAGCSEDYSTLDAKQPGRIKQATYANHTKPKSSIEEYVSRVGKKTIIVSNNANAIYRFSVNSSSTPEIEFDLENNTITVSHGLLANLHDEAELAAVLTRSMAKLSHEPEPDRATLNNLFRAGYDPQALIDLQEQYIFAKNSGGDMWLSTIYTIPIDESNIEANKVIVSKMPKGLLRGMDEYQKQLGNL
jgi:predicted Zn-dependent protease